MKSVVEKLAADLQIEFHEMKALSNRNMWRMRMFYVEYKKLPPMVAEISWSSNIIIIVNAKTFYNEFYTKMVIKYGWIKAVLIQYIKGEGFENFLTGQTNFDKTLPDKYNFEFLE